MQADDFMPNGAEIARITKNIQAYETERRDTSRRVFWRVPLFIGAAILAVAILALVFNILADPSEKWFSAPHMFLYFFGLGAVLVVWHRALKPARDMQQAFRNKVLPAIFGGFIKDLRYRNDARPDSFDRLPRDAVGTFNRQTFDDVISGEYEGFAFELYEVRLSYKSGKSDTNLFRGIVLTFDLERPFPGLLLATRKANVVVGLFRNLFGGGNSEELKSGIESLDDVYEFRSDNVVAARPLVVGRLASALQWLGEAWPDAPARVALHGNDGFLLLPQTKDFFELPGINTSISYSEHLRPIIADMASLLATGALVRKVGGEGDAANENAEHG